MTIPMGGRLWLWLVVAACAAGAPAAGQVVLDFVPARKGDGAKAPADATSLLERGKTADESGDLVQADALYRAAWERPELREEAAARLKRLHTRPGFRLPADSVAVEELRGQLGNEFIRHDTAHFVILSDCDRSWTAARGQVLERTRTQFYRVSAKMGTSVVPHRHKLVCILFHDQDKYRAFSRARDGVRADWVAGYYSTLSNRIAFYNEASGAGYAAANAELDDHRSRVRRLRDESAAFARGGDADAAARAKASADELERRIKSAERSLRAQAAADSTRKTVHECIHLLAYNTGLQRPGAVYPLWVSEGLATSFETDQANEAFGPDRAATSNRGDVFDEMAADGSLIESGELVSTVDAPESAEAAERFYSQSYVLFRRLFGSDPEAVGRYVEALGEGTARTREELAALFMAHFGDGATHHRVGAK